jgi:hypothetical protein
MLKSNTINYLLILLKISVLFFVVYKFNLEKDTQIQKIIPFIIGGFAVHYWLPFRFKIPFFTLLSFSSIILLLGPLNGGALIIVGFLIITTCHLPIKYNLRLVLILLLISFFISVGLHIIPITSLLVPFIGTMFLMRVMLYFYELKYEDKSKNIWQRISYFFLLPNVLFPLFPLIDYKAFTKTYFNTSNKNEIYQLAIRRIYRGVVHLIVYRFIYYYLVPDPSSINEVYSILQFLIFSYTLILRLSGIFHLSLGILGLFGFNLPEVFNNYFFASSFSNIWQRVNTYWRDALMKLFYYPIYFKIKKKLKSFALPISIIIVFIFNWLLHGYQWFWVRGSFPLTPNDILFWSIFGAAVMFNSIYLENKSTPKKLLKSNSWNLKKALILILKTLGMFAFMSILWTLWTSSSLTEWLYLLHFLGKGNIMDYVSLIVIFIIATCSILYLNYSLNHGWLKHAIQFYNRHINILTSIFIFILFLFSFPNLFPQLHINNNNIISGLQESRLNTKDKKVMERGYYQNLLNNEKTSMQLWQTENEKPKEWSVKNNAQVKTNNILQKKLKPNQHVFFKGSWLTTNDFGMRDKNYSLKKPTNTYRLILLGGSYEMGSGVGDNENYESIAENLLNKQNDKNFEILNLSVGGYHLFESEYNASYETKKYQPDAVIYTAHSNEFYRVNNKLTTLFKLDSIVKNPFLLEIFKLAGVKSKMCRLEIHNRLKPFIPHIIKWGYKSIVLNCKKNNIRPVWVFLPALGDDNQLSDFEKGSMIAKSAGFTTISLAGVYDNHNKNSLMIASWDSHPNKKGHAIIGHKLYQELLLNSKKLELKK